mmetsp:Transcript_16766/g.38718  ORF Transcript_16766/g.38718 Transcript_16766/m.38718 type:complete len:298 (+) Transcript_16766:254-1147(+)
MSRKSARKRKSDDIADVDLDELNASLPEFFSSHELTAKPTILNSRDAFFDKKDSFGPHITNSPVEHSIGTERVIRTAKSFIDDDDRIAGSPSSNIFSPSPRKTPIKFRRDSYTKSLQKSSVVGTPCGVVDELFTGIYGCMPSWECSLPWTEESDDDSADDEIYRNGRVHRDAAGHDANGMREHLSFPRHLGREYASQSEEKNSERKNKTFDRKIRRSPSLRPMTEESVQDRKHTTINQTIRRSPSSRLTTLESDSRHKLPGSKMIRRTEINQVTEIHWDEEVLDTKTLEQMAKLSVH